MANIPKRVIFGSENRHQFAAWTAVRDNAYISGQYLWTGIDYLGEAYEWPSHGNAAGLLDTCGFKKPTGWFRQSLWTDKPMVFIVQRPRETRTPAAAPAARRGAANRRKLELAGRFPHQRATIFVWRHLNSAAAEKFLEGLEHVHHTSRFPGGVCFHRRHGGYQPRGHGTDRLQRHYRADRSSNSAPPATPATIARMSANR